MLHLNKWPWVEKHAVNKSLLDTFAGIKRTGGNSFCWSAWN